MAAQISLVILALLAAVTAAYVARPILFPLALAALIAFALRPVDRMLIRKLRAPAIAVSVILVISIVTLIGGAIFMLSGPATKWISNAPQNFEKIEYKIRPVKESVEEISKAADQIEEITAKAKDPDKLKVEVARPTLTDTVLSMTTEVLIELGITISFLFLLLAYGDDLLKRMSKLAPKGEHRASLYDLFNTIESVISRYLFTFSLINMGLGTVIGLGMWAIGMPNPLLWGVMAACLNFIPYLGLITGSAIVFFVGLVTFESPFYAALAPGIYYVANLIEANAVTPALLGKALSVNVIVLFLSIIFWGWLWGIGGIIIAVPLMGAFKVICDHTHALRYVARFLGGGLEDEVDEVKQEQEQAKIEPRGEPEAA